MPPELMPYCSLGSMFVAFLGSMLVAAGAGKYISESSVQGRGPKRDEFHTPDPHLEHCNWNYQSMMGSF